MFQLFLRMTRGGGLRSRCRAKSNRCASDAEEVRWHQGGCWGGPKSPDLSVVFQKASTGTARQGRKPLPLLLLERETSWASRECLRMKSPIPVGSGAGEDSGGLLTTQDLMPTYSAKANEISYMDLVNRLSSRQRGAGTRDKALSPVRTGAAIDGTAPSIFHDRDIDYIPWQNNLEKRIPTSMVLWMPTFGSTARKALGRAVPVRH